MSRLFYLKKLLFFLFSASLIVVILGIYTTVRPASKCTNCNVVLVSLDTLRADDLPCYGYKNDTAPNLCKFAKDNVLFENMFTQSSYTLTSHYSLFTSLYPSSHGILYGYSQDVLRPAHKTLTEVLKGRGYETIYVGPTTDTNLPLNKGIGRGFDYVFTGDIEGWGAGLSKLEQNSKTGKPTFLFLHSYRVHDPYIVDTNLQRLFSSGAHPNIPLSEKEYRQFTPDFLASILKNLSDRIAKGGDQIATKDLEIYKDKLTQAKNIDEAAKIFSTLPVYEQNSFYGARYPRPGIQKTDTQQIQYLRGLYDERIWYQDQELQTTFYGFLSARGLLKNTIVAITADHGDEFMEHGNFFHASNVYNSTTHVPLIMAIPGVKRKRIQTLTQSIDIYPTLLSLLDIPTLSPVEGTSFANYLLGRALLQKEQYLFSEHANWSSVRSGKWKLYTQKEGNETKIELYNTQKDPDEQKDIHNTEIVITNNLLIVLKKFRNTHQITSPTNSTFPEWIDPLKKDKLIKEGYF